MWVFEAHTDPTDLTVFARLVENLTETLRFVGFGAHTDPTLTVFARLVENLTDDSWALLQWVKEKKSEYSERSEYSEFCMVEGLGFV